MGDEEYADGYVARKQTHLHKLAMVLSASRSDDLVISIEDLVLANAMLEETEKKLDMVFSRIGRSEESLQAERFIDFIKRQGRVPYTKAYKYIHSYFPDFRDFEGVVTGAVRSGVIRMEFTGTPRMGPDGKMMQDIMLVHCTG